MASARLLDPKTVNIVPSTKVAIQPEVYTGKPGIMGLRATFLTGGVHSVVIEREDGGVGVQVNYTDFPAHTGVVGCMDKKHLYAPPGHVEGVWCERRSPTRLYVVILFNKEPKEQDVTAYRIALSFHSVPNAWRTIYYTGLVNAYGFGFLNPVAGERSTIKLETYARRVGDMVYMGCRSSTAIPQPANRHISGRMIARSIHFLNSKPTNPPVKRDLYGRASFTVVMPLCGVNKPGLTRRLLPPYYNYTVMDGQNYINAVPQANNRPCYFPGAPLALQPTMNKFAAVSVFNKHYNYTTTLVSGERVSTPYLLAGSLLARAIKSLKASSHWGVGA